MSLIHLVRHGQASAGTDNYDRLSDIGREQSRILGNWWLSHGFAPNLAFHGSLERQRDTALISLQALAENTQIANIKEHAGLNEYDHRIIESHFAPDEVSYTPEAMGFDDYFGIISRWRDNTSNQPESSLQAACEPWQEFKARGWNTVQELTSNGDEKSESVFFTSGGVIATLLATVLDLDFEHTVDAIWRIRNSSVTSFQITNGHARLIEFNSIAHLQEQRKPHLITMI